ncbi:MAG: HepT-like ribonuclease domain-containing protein [Actinomycetota bacterium]
MSRSDTERIEDILEYADKIANAVALGHHVFLSDQYVSPAVERFIEVLGEAARQLSDARKADFPEINWGEIVGLRTRLAHIYHRIDIENIWGAASHDVPNLARVLREK